MIVNVCGAMDAAAIKMLSAMGVDMAGLVFVNGSSCRIPMLPSRTGLMPDGPAFSPSRQESALSENQSGKRFTLCGIFKNDMPQNIITAVYNYNLQTVMLCGDESAVMIDNLRRSVDPDIMPGLRIIKSVYVASPADLSHCEEYAGMADMLLFYADDAETCSKAVASYEGNIPFLMAIAADSDMSFVRNVTNPLFEGVSLLNVGTCECGIPEPDVLSRLVSELHGICD